ncbi:unnamed protein product, partial [Polarella glacialis]
MAQQHWQRVVSAKTPASFGGGSDATSGSRLELRGVCLSVGGDGAGPTIFCSVAGGPAFAVARPSHARPYCQVRLQLDAEAGEAKFTCVGQGQVLVVGVTTSLALDDDDKG